MMTWTKIGVVVFELVGQHLANELAATWVSERFAAWALGSLCTLTRLQALVRTIKKGAKKMVAVTAAD